MSGVEEGWDVGGYLLRALSPFKCVPWKRELEIVTPCTTAPVQGGGNDEEKPNLEDKLCHRCTIVSQISNLEKVMSSISAKISWKFLPPEFFENLIILRLSPKN